MRKSKNIQFFCYLGLMGMSVFTLYFLALAFAEPVGQLVIYMNDAKREHSVMEWLIFLPSALVCTIGVCALILIGEHAKGKLLDLCRETSRGSYRGPRV